MASSDATNRQGLDKEVLARERTLREQYLAAEESVEKARLAVKEAERKRREAKRRMVRMCSGDTQNKHRYRRAWRDYNRLRARNNACIELLRYEMDDEKRRAENCKMNAMDALHCMYDEISAVDYFTEQYQHDEVREGIQAEIDELLREIDDAKEKAELVGIFGGEPEAKLCDAKADFRAAKLKHNNALRELKRIKAERNRLKREFKTAKAERECISRLRAKEPGQDDA